MKCSNCGFENRPGVRFCEKCGQTLAKPVAAVAEAPPVRAEKKAPAQPAAVKITCPSCGFANRSGLRFCEACGTALGRPAPRSRLVATLANWIGAARRNPWKAATISLLSIVVIALLFAGLDRLRFSVTKSEARDMAEAAVQVYYPQLADVTPQIQEIKDENGDTLLSYSYFDEVTVQIENGNPMQFTYGAVAVVNRNTGEVEIMSVR